VKHDFGNARARLATLTIIPLRVRGNDHARLVVPAKLAEINLVLTRADQAVVLVPTGLTILDKVTMPTVDPGKVHAHSGTLTNTPPNLPENDLVKPATFANALTPTTKLTKDIINSIACQGIRGRKPRNAYASASVSLTTIAMKSTMIIHIRSNATDLSQIPKLLSLIGEHCDHAQVFHLPNGPSEDGDESGLRYSLAA